MKILAIDCTAVAASVAIVEDGKVISSSYTNVGLTHSQTLVPMVSSVLGFANMDLKDIDYFGINAGPGSFTGVRIGVAALKGLTEFREDNCFGVSTLESMAYNLLGLEDCIAVCAMDARCNQIYTASFDLTGGTVTRLSEDEAILIPDLEDRLKTYEKPVVFVGDGALLCYNYYLDKISNASLAPAHVQYQNATSVALLVEANLKAGVKPVSSASLMPVYLRAPQAERELKKKQALT